MQPEKPAPVDRRSKILNLTLASVAAQVGCLTLVIILGAVLGGLWLDNRYGSKPMFTDWVIGCKYSRFFSYNVYCCKICGIQDQDQATRTNKRS